MPSLNVSTIVGLALSVLAFAAGWEVNGWRLGASLGAQKAATASSDAQTTRKALDDLVSASATVHAAAADYADIQDRLSAKIDSIQKALRDVPPAPLPPDCKPTPDRMRAVSGAIDAANTAAAGSR